MQTFFITNLSYLLVFVNIIRALVLNGLLSLCRKHGNVLTRLAFFMTRCVVLIVNLFASFLDVISMHIRRIFSSSFKFLIWNEQL